jgi:hypothetical protein
MLNISGLELAWTHDESGATEPAIASAGFTFTLPMSVCAVNNNLCCQAADGSVVHTCRRRTSDLGQTDPTGGVRDADLLWAPLPCGTCCTSSNYPPSWWTMRPLHEHRRTMVTLNADYPSSNTCCWSRPRHNIGRHTQGTFATRDGNHQNWHHWGIHFGKITPRSLKIPVRDPRDPRHTNRLEPTCPPPTLAESRGAARCAHAGSSTGTGTPSGMLCVYHTRTAVDRTTHMEMGVTIMGNNCI